MSFNITEAFVQQYATNVDLLLQQRGSKLMDCVMPGSYTGKSGQVVHQIGAVEATERTTRHGDTQYGNEQHTSRWVFPSDCNRASLIDDVDKLRMVIDPTSPYAINHAYAMGRKADDQIITAALGDAKTGENGGTTTSFDTANQQVTVGGTPVGLTINKLRQAREILLANEVDTEFDQLYILVSAKQLTDMLETTEATSTDYASVKALVQGEIDTFLGFKFKHTERLGVDASSYRRVIAFAKSGLHFGSWGGVITKIDELPTKQYSTQVYTAMTSGATRLEEGKVVEILCNEAQSGD